MNLKKITKRIVRRKWRDGRRVMLNGDGAWTWFHGPHATYHAGTRSRTYFTWSSHGIWIGSFDHGSGSVERFRLLDTRQNDHNVAAVQVRSDSRLLVAYSEHNGTMYVRTSEGPESVTAWSEPVVVRPKRATYPNLHYLSSEGRWYLFYRGGPRGDWPMWYITSDDDGQTWSDEVCLFRNGIHRPYFQVTSNGEDQLDVLVTEGHPNAVPTNSLYHLRYQRGRWASASGERTQSLPFEPSSAGLVYDGSSPSGRAWCWDIAQAADGTMVALFTTIRNAEQHELHYATALANGRWNVRSMTKVGGHIYEGDGEPEYSPGAALSREDPGVVFLSRDVGDRRYEIERWSTRNRGTSWKSEPLTDASPPAPFKNFRPAVVHGGGPFEVLWCAGDYRTYRDYLGGIGAWERRMPRTLH